MANHFKKRGIVIQKQSQEYVRAQETHKSYYSLQYPLLF